MWNSVPFAIVIPLYLGHAFALPIADIRANVSITLPFARPTPKVEINKAKDEVLNHVARMINKVHKSAFRYGKRSAPLETDLGQKEFIPEDPEENMYSARGTPALSDINRRPFTYKDYLNIYFLEQAKHRRFPTIRKFDSLAAVLLADLQSERNDQEKANRMQQSPGKSDVNRLLDMVEIMENRQNTVPLKKINNSYRNASYTRARPGKRSAPTQEQQTKHSATNGPVVFSKSLGEKPYDVNKWFNKATVAEKKTVAFGKDGFRLGNRSMTVGYN